MKNFSAQNIRKYFLMRTNRKLLNLMSWQSYPTLTMEDYLDKTPVRYWRHPRGRLEFDYSYYWTWDYYYKPLLILHYKYNNLQFYYSIKKREVFYNEFGSLVKKAQRYFKNTKKKGIYTRKRKKNLFH